MPGVRGKVFQFGLVAGEIPWRRHSCQAVPLLLYAGVGYGATVKVSSLYNSSGMNCHTSLESML